MTSRDPDLPDGRSGGEGDAAASALLHALAHRGWTIAVAESLTGGLLVAALVSVPGASSLVRGGVTAYATDLKHHLLGVDDTLLHARGAVDPEVALQMAGGVRDRLGADVGVSTTGVAGPDPQDGQPVGTVFVGIRTPDTSVVVPLDLHGTRAEIRAETVRRALDEVRART
ncbi:nicotinamide-nucleotide amidase [Microbacterium sp. AK009]|uniref:CinA family protein n=1 Tax=Microbacterium sp. AK009 TaxID=2723068 RepID=UPI0015CDF48A|nr:CinA family protein [Microbacterium sp. AK009]NYF16428.1 nicotinamide-nucleotide amidase [Microbacterium sp. AK009]